MQLVQDNLFGGQAEVVAEIEEEQEGPQRMTDPRMDLGYDSVEWTRILNLALLVQQNKELAWILHGFRCCGLRLHKGRNGWALRPDFDPKSSNWDTPEEYNRDRDKWLVPHEKEIIELLRQL